MFSVVIPNFQRVKELHNAIQSVLSQDGASCYLSDIVIVDDNSSNIEEIERVISEFNDSRIKLIKNKFKSNAAKTRNQGAKNSTGEWVCFLDSDDVFLKGKFLELKKRICSNSDVYYNKAAIYFNSNFEKSVPSRPLIKGERIGDYLFVSGEILQTSTLTIRKSFFDNYGFNENYNRHQDYDFILTIEQLELKLEFVDHVSTAIYWGSNTRYNVKGETYQYSARWLEENSNRLSKKAIACFYFKFIVMRAAQSKQKMYSISKIRLSHITTVGKTNIILYLAILLTPTFLQERAYTLFKNLNRNRKR